MALCWPPSATEEGLDIKTNIQEFVRRHLNHLFCRDPVASQLHAQLKAVGEDIVEVLHGALLYKQDFVDVRACSSQASSTELTPVYYIGPTSGHQSALLVTPASPTTPES